MKKITVLWLTLSMLFITSCGSVNTQTEQTLERQNIDVSAETTVQTNATSASSAEPTVKTTETTVDGDEPFPTDIPDYTVLEVYSGDSYSGIGAKHSFEVKNSRKNIDKLTAESKESLNILGTEFALNYTETLYYPIGDEKVDVYQLVNDDVELRENARVTLFQDGSIYEILGYTVAKIDIDEITNEQLIKKVEYELRNLIDFSKYNYVDVIKPSGYSITWRKIRADGYKTDEMVLVWVSSNGEIFAITIYPNRDNLFDINIDLSEAEKDALISKKLSEIFDTDELSFDGYEISGESLTMYEGKPCLSVSVKVNITLKSKDISLSRSSKLLIVLE